MSKYLKQKIIANIFYLLLSGKRTESNWKCSFAIRQTYYLTFCCFGVSVRQWAQHLQNGQRTAERKPESWQKELAIKC